MLQALCGIYTEVTHTKIYYSHSCNIMVMIVDFYQDMNTILLSSSKDMHNCSIIDFNVTTALLATTCTAVNRACVQLF